jgi:hypothetical protein
MTISRLRRRSGWLALAGILFCGCLPAQAQQFSAEIMIMKDKGATAPAGTVYVAGGKERIETPEHTDGFFVIDGVAPTAYFVQPSARQFMDAGQSSRLTQIFVPVDPDNPCLQWEAMATLAGAQDHGAWHCERVGQETIDGSSAIAYRATSASGREVLGWVDPMRKFPLRIKAEDGTVFEVGNLHDQPQAAELFEIPANFRKFDPRALIDRIKQSDVWVENRERHGGP